MKTISRVLMGLMLLLAVIHVVDFVRDRQLYHLLAAAGFGLLAYGNFRMGDAQVGPDGRFVRRDRAGQVAGAVGAALVIGYFVLKFGTAAA